MKPLCIDLFCGTFAWSAGWLELGGRVVGFDIERLSHHGPVPAGAELVLQDVLTLHGWQFRDASLILASPPCQAYSYRAMPWKRAKALPPPSNELFNSCFRIHREACEAAGHYIPMVVENVRGAQPWVGAAAWHYGSFYLWGDVPALMPNTLNIKRPGRNFHAFENGLGSSPAFNGADHETRGVKQHGSGAEWFDKALDERRAAATKNGNDWFGSGENCSLQRRASSRSPARKAASALIAKIPLDLARHIARCYYPRLLEAER